MSTPLKTAEAQTARQNRQAARDITDPQYLKQLEDSVRQWNGTKMPRPEELRNQD